MTKDREPSSGSWAASGAASGPASWGDRARRVDPDRFLTVLGAPAAAREALFALIALNHELVRAVELPSAQSGAGPIASFIRLQWWREVIEGSRGDWTSQEIAVRIRALIEARRVRPETLLGLVDAREAEADGLPGLADWRRTMRAGSGGLQRAIGEVLGVSPDQGPRLEAAGAAYGCGALRRHLPAILASGRSPIASDMMQQAGLGQDSAFDSVALSALRDILAREGQVFLAQAAGPSLPPAQRAALLPLVLAQRDLAAPEQRLAHAPAGRGVFDRLAVLRRAVLA